MAEAMGRLGYAASALGNHELDFGRDAFFANRALSGVRYLAANLSDVTGAVDTGAAGELAQPYVIVERGGVRVGVLGLASVHTLTTAVASRFGAVRLEEPEATLGRAVPELWAAGADVALLLVHECVDELVPALERHPEWQLSFVGSGHCHRELDSTVGGTAIMSSGWNLDHYARARLRVTPGAEGPRRAELLEHAIVEVSSPVAEPAPSIDPALDGRVAGWQQEVERALGEVIGFSARGLGREAPELGEWVVESWRRRLSVDVAVTTRGSIRQELPPGPITLATISAILPFDNELVVASVPGEMLLAMLREPAVIATGARRTADGGFVLGNGRKLRPDARYRVATTDYLYGGGDHCRFREADPAAQMTGVGWRQPVIDWTRALGSRAGHPLESLLPRLPR
jgi:2',3'-cyclic-nucleotide 2'-phosphodiesterase (5'-nucleotidase family)